MKVRAGALLYAIAISFIIAILTSTIILIAFYGSLNYAAFTINTKLQLNCDSGMNLLLSEQNLVGADEKKTLDLYGNGMDSVNLQRISWGAFEVAVSESVFKGKKQRACALIGYSAGDSTALYLCNSSRPLSLCGKAILKGTCYLPEAGIKRAYIEGQSFIGDRFVEGAIKQSPALLPAINTELLAQIKKCLDGNPGANDSVIEISGRLEMDSLVQSFTGKTSFIYSSTEILIDNQLLEGNIKIVSGKKIKIGKNAALKDIVVCAPEVFIEKGFTGSLQVIAGDSIGVEEDCHLLYPSSLVLIKTKGENNAWIIIKKNSSVSGIVSAIKEKPELKGMMNVSIDKDAWVEGLVFSSDLADIKGSIYGSLYTRGIILITPSSVYENHLLGAVINPSLRSRFFTSINLIRNSETRSVAKWLF